MKIGGLCKCGLGPVGHNCEAAKISQEEMHSRLVVDAMQEPGYPFSVPSSAYVEDIALAVSRSDCESLRDIAINILSERNSMSRRLVEFRARADAQAAEASRMRRERDHYMDRAFAAEAQLDGGSSQETCEACGLSHGGSAAGHTTELVTSRELSGNSPTSPSSQSASNDDSD